MTTFTLTTGADNLSGGDQADSFLGPGGGTDHLFGGGGNDRFEIGQDSAGTVDGGDGVDTVFTGPLGKVKFTNVEVLDTGTGQIVVGTLSQLSSFSSIICSAYPGSTLNIILTGTGGTYDFASHLEAGAGVWMRYGSGFTSAVNLSGTSVNDTLIGSADADTMDGGDGNDLILAGHGGTLIGGKGNDEFGIGEATNLALTTVVDCGAGNDYVAMQGGPASVDGGAGLDAVTGDIRGSTFVSVETLRGSGIIAEVEQLSSFQNVTAWTYFEVLLSGEGGSADVSSWNVDSNIQFITFKDYGLSAGIDLVGTGGADQVYGSSFSDTISSGGGNDTIFASAGDDQLDGGDGDDSIEVGSGQTALGGSGGDSFRLANSAKAIDGGSGLLDRIIAAGYSADLTGTSISNVEYLYVEDGVTLSIGQIYQFQLIESSGQVALSLSGAGGTLNLLGRVAPGLGVNLRGTQLTSALHVTGTESADWIIGSSFNDVIDGGNGQDTLIGRDGNDTYVNPGADSVAEFAGQGTDTIESDTTISLVDNVERLRLTGSGAINGTGNSVANLIIGNASNNLIAGLSDNDTLNAGAGSDTLQGGAGSDLLRGATQRDKLVPGVDSNPDILIFSTLNDSTGVSRDVLDRVDFNDEDMIDLPGVVSGIAAAITTGTLSLATFNANLVTAVTAAALPAGHAVLFDPNAGNLDQPGMVYLIVDANGVAGYQANQDWVFQLENCNTAFLDLTDFL